MLRFLSFFNIFCALLNFLMFLTGSYTGILGALIVVAFNGLVIKNIQQEKGIGIIHYLAGLCCLCFAGFLSYGLFYIVRSSIDHHYFKNTWLYISLTGLLILGIVLHFIVLLSARKSP